MARRPRHVDNQVEQVLTEAEGHGWAITFENGKFKCWCACGKHSHAISRGTQQYRAAKNLRSQLMKCWH